MKEGKTLMEVFGLLPGKETRMKFCKDCQHCKLDLGGLYRCESPNRPMVNPVTGEKFDTDSPSLLRDNSVYCGLDAKWFSPKTVDPGEGWRLLKEEETLQIGDEFWFDGKWNASIAVSCTPTKSYNSYRRRIEPLIERCPEGHEAECLPHNHHGEFTYYVNCKNNTCLWRGNPKPTKQEAIESWNAPMRAYHASKEGK